MNSQCLTQSFDRLTYKPLLACLLLLSIFPLASTQGLCALNLPNTSITGQTGVLTGGVGTGGTTTQPDVSYDKPRAPGQPGLVSRSSTAIKLQWRDNSSYEQGYRLYRGNAYNGPWTQIASWGAKPGNSTLMEFVDSGLPRDRAYYYRVGAYNFYGESYSIPQVLATIDGRKFSRLQLRIRTSTISDANSDDDVNVSLRDNDNGGTWLDYGRDDFERGDDFTYELMANGLSDLSDINHIYLLKPGTNGWCVESVALLADGVEIFKRNLATATSPCQWLDNESPHRNYLVIGRAALRAHPLWQGYKQSLPSLSLLRTDLESRIEGMVGNLIHYHVPVDAFPIYQGSLDVAWTDQALDGESHVAITKKDNQAVHVHFELGIDTPGPGGLTGGLDFDLRFTGICRTETAPAKIVMATENIYATADFDWTTEAVSLWLANLLENNIAKKIKASFPSLTQVITVDNEVISCVTPVVASDGTVDFALAFAKRTLPGSVLTTTGSFSNSLNPTR